MIYPQFCNQLSGQLSNVRDDSLCCLTCPTGLCVKPVNIHPCAKNVHPVFSCLNKKDYNYIVFEPLVHCDLNTARPFSQVCPNM